MNRMFAALSRKFTFQRQLGFMVTLGILFLALCSSVVGSWQGNERVRNDLIEQGQHITENLARQSTLALVYSSADNAAEAVNVTMAFPGVVGVEIRTANGKLLLARGEVNFAEFFEQTNHPDGLQAAAVLNVESGKAWNFSAPVYSQPSKESPFSEAAAPELLGQVSVVMSKAALTRMTTDIFASNLATSFSFALLFLLLIRFLTRSMTQPLTQLSASMGRAQRGESQVRAIPGGPKDIAEMAHAFNRMMTEQEEREAALRIAAIAFETEEGMMVTDENAVIIRVNQAFTRLTGYSAGEAIGKNPSLLKSDRQDEEFFQRMWDSLRRDNSWQGEVWSRRKNGEDFPGNLTVTAVKGVGGILTNYVVIFSDITERIKAEEQQLNSFRQLEQKELDKTRFLAAAGHDLRQPVAAAKLLVDALKSTSPSQRQSDLIARLDQSMSVFSSLLARLLDISRFDAGLVKPQFTSFDLREMFGWLDHTFSQAALDKQLHLRFFFPENKSLLVRSDIGLVQSVLMNLVANAIKFTERGSILVSARLRGDKVLVQVWDTGIGIAETDLPHIFDEFYQVANPQRNREEGLGLGLSISHRAMSLLGGEITCRSRTGRGSVCGFTLPLDGEQHVIEPLPVNSASDEAANEMLFRGKIVVVVEDDELVAQAMISLLEGMGAKVKCFHSAEDALSHAYIGYADYYIADYMLGGALDGMQFLSQVRQKLGKPINAVLMTGDTSTDFMRNAKNCDWPVLHKPVSVSRLISSLGAQVQ